jgi:hypothetical protein
MSLSLRFIISCAVGVAAHLGLFIRGEWHMQAPIVFVLHVLVGSFTAFSAVWKQGLSLPYFIDASVMVVGYLIGVFSSIAAYRLSLSHRSSNFPGPRLAAVSKFWHVWQCRDSGNHELMDRLHHKYGDFVRTSMIRLFQTNAF